MSNTIEVLSAVHGIAPRSDELLLLGSDLRNGRVSQSAFDEQVALETEGWLALQAEAGINLREDGKLSWQDHLRPIVKATKGFAPRIDDAPVTPWYEDNRFYRQPTVVKELDFDGEVFGRLTGQPGESVSLIGPQTFFELVKSNLWPAETAKEIEKLYVQLCEYYAAQGVRHVLFEEPDAGLQRKSAGIQLHSFVPVAEALGIDIVKIPSRIFETDASGHAKRTQWSYGQKKAATWQATTIVRAVDAGNTAEDAPLQPTIEVGGRYILTHTVDLEKIPLKHARDKVKRLGEFTAKLRGELGQRND